MKQLRKYQSLAIQEAWQALKENDAPVLLEASVGSGKSIMIGTVLKTIQDQNKRALCLVNSSELVRSNSLEFEGIGGKPSIFCASLNKKEHSNNIIFATPQSIMSAIKANHPIKDILFNMLIVDEAHGIGNDKSIYMKILRHYKQQYKPMRTLGLTGTAFRGSTNIVGHNAFFKTKVGNISTQYLIEEGFLVPPVFGYHEVEGFDFSKLKPKNNGEFNGSELQTVIDSKKRLTWKIMQEVQQIMESHSVCIVFCSTRKHCFETLEAIPEGQGRIILGNTPDNERDEILTKARNKELKYIISVNCLLTGINIPCLDLIVWLRPTSSLLLYIQGIGRGLRLYPGKTSCTVLDYAQNICRFEDIDHPIINEAIQPQIEDDPDYCIECYTCGTMNKITTRRCLGVIDKKRCTHYFEFKECPSCHLENDKVSRQCRGCQHELIDPNAKLSASKSTDVKLDVIKSSYWVSRGPNSTPIIHEKYDCQYVGREICVGNSNFTNSEKNKNITYAKFIRQHVKDASAYYPKMGSYPFMSHMVNQAKLKSPSHIICKYDGESLKISRKIFSEY